MIVLLLFYFISYSFSLNFKFTSFPPFFLLYGFSYIFLHIHSCQIQLHIYTQSLFIISYFKGNDSQVWRLTPVTLTLQKWRHGDQEFEASVSYTENLRPALHYFRICLKKYYCYLNGAFNGFCSILISDSLSGACPSATLTHARHPSFTKVS